MLVIEPSIITISKSSKFYKRFYTKLYNYLNPLISNVSFLNLNAINNVKYFNKPSDMIKQVKNFFFVITK